MPNPIKYMRCRIKSVTICALKNSRMPYNTLDLNYLLKRRRRKKWNTAVAKAQDK